MDKFCEIYNDVPSILVAYAAMVNLSADTYLKKTDQIIFKEENNSNYWIIPLASVEDSAWLVPNPLSKVNYVTLKSFPYAFDSNKKKNLERITSFLLTEPAQVIALPTEPKTWKLAKRGTINFFLNEDVKKPNGEFINRIEIEKMVKDLVSKQLEEVKESIVKSELIFQDFMFTKSHVAVVGSRQNKATKPLLLIAPQIATAWDIAPQDICVYKDKTMASLDIEELRVGRILGWDDVKCIEPRDLLLPELTFLDIDGALPGGFSIQSDQRLRFNNNLVTPLLPFNSLLLEYFTPEDLMGRIQFNQNDDMVEVTINLTLSGLDNSSQSNPRDYTVSRNYCLSEKNMIEDCPVLEIWPNIRIEGWKHYYAFYFDANDTFKVSFEDAEDPHTYSDRNGDYIITRLSNFPTHINCQRQGYPVGFILLRTPIEQKLSDTWVVGVDFGTSFTNVYVNHKGKVEPLQLENLHLKITAANVETRMPVLFESFIPEVFVPADKPLPLATILTRLGETRNEQKKVLYDGRIYVPDRINFHPESTHIETDFRLKNSVYSRLFLENLALIISALAAKNGVEEIQWSVSYPSAFSRKEINTYARLWRNLTEDLQKWGQFKTEVQRCYTGTEKNTS